MTFGEAAHIIGQTASPKSPRGLDEDLDQAARDSADNLMLLCDDEHSELDKLGSRDAFTPEFLRQLKYKHEERVRHVTGFGEYDRTTPIRMVGMLRGRAVDVGRDAVATAVMANAGRMPKFDLSVRHSIEIDIRNIPGEEGPSSAYYESACAAIDKAIGTKVTEALSNDDIVHLSVFAFARLPLLVYLGAALDDTVPVDLYQRHRATENWQWTNPDAEATFSLSAPTKGEDFDSAVLILNISGTIERRELPDALASLPTFGIEVKGIAHPDIISGPNVLVGFVKACRLFLSELEDGFKRVRLLHVFAAMPVSAAVAFGRCLAPEVHPAIQLCDRQNDGHYTTAIRIGAQ
ncbi:SAVED domain-containing protein [Nocardia amikacinitolerans]|uniref:SAVED domain-containing protein n=1 Tax=Nocardia amikacinitolerans TaxID=756689 RepID=UPI001180B131|nr:SAVED domain-containing protein [Nocardia amikacinitolerans]